MVDGLLVVCPRPERTTPLPGAVPVGCVICTATVLVSPSSTVLLVSGARAICPACAHLVRPRP